MMEKLKEDYDINVDKMLDIKEVISGFKIIIGNFISPMTKGDKSVQILSNDNDRQIFKMNDGKYILEKTNDDMEIVYFYSSDVNELNK